MTSRHAQLPGLTDECRVLAFPPVSARDRRARWLPRPRARTVSRLAVVVVSAAAGFALAWLIK